MIITACIRMAGFRLSPVVTVDGSTMFNAKLERDGAALLCCAYT